MRIALFSDTYLPQINGVATHVKTLRDGLEGVGHSVLVVTADTAAKSHYIEDGVLHCPAATLKQLYDYGAASSHNRERQHLVNDFQPDIVHIHTEFGVGWSGVHTARRMGIPLVYTLHTMYDQYLHYLVPHPLIPAARRAVRDYIGYYGKIANEVIGPSARAGEFLSSCGVHREVRVVSNAVELDRLSREQADKERVRALRQQYGIAEDDFVICFCGRLGQEKSVDVLLDFFAACTRVENGMKLMIIGDGPMRKELEKHAQGLGLGRTVIFAGGVPHDHVREAYACCDLFATASRSEVNSISMLEAMAMGLPALLIVDEENPGQVTEGVNGYLYRSAEEFSALVQRLKRDPDALARLRMSTVESVQMAGQEGLAKRVEEVYRLCTQKKRAASGRS